MNGIIARNITTRYSPHHTTQHHTTTTPHPTTSTEDEIQDDNDVDDMDDVDMSSTPKEASSFPLGKKHTRTVESSPNKKPKKKTKPLRSKQL